MCASVRPRSRRLHPVLLWSQHLHNHSLRGRRGSGIHGSAWCVLLFIKCALHLPIPNIDNLLCTQMYAQVGVGAQQVSAPPGCSVLQSKPGAQPRPCAGAGPRPGPVNLQPLLPLPDPAPRTGGRVSSCSGRGDAGREGRGVTQPSLLPLGSLGTEVSPSPTHHLSKEPKPQGQDLIRRNKTFGDNNYLNINMIILGWLV